MDGFGVEMRDVDLATCEPDVHRAVVETFDRHGIMVIRGQSLSPDEQMRFTRAFGTPEDNPRREYTYPGIPEIYVISNKVVDGRKIGSGRLGPITAEFIKAFKALNAEDFGDGKGVAETGLDAPEATLSISLKDNAGMIRLGPRAILSYQQLKAINWYVDGVEGAVPK